MWCLVWVRVLCWIKAVPLALCPHTAAADKMVKGGGLARPPSSAQDISTQHTTLLCLVSTPTLIISDVGKGGTCAKLPTSLSGLHQPMLALLGVTHLHGHWAHLWYLSQVSEQLGEIATLGIIAPQLFVASCISYYTMVFTMGLSICVLPFKHGCLVSVLEGVCWRCHHQLSCLRFCWTHWLTLPQLWSLVN